MPPPPRPIPIEEPFERPAPHGSSELVLRKNGKVEAIAITATVLSIGSYIPLAVDVFTHPNRQIETTSYIVYTLGISSLFLWLGYGVAIKSPSLVITTSV